MWSAQASGVALATCDSCRQHSVYLLWEAGNELFDSLGAILPQSPPLAAFAGTAAARRKRTGSCGRCGHTRGTGGISLGGEN